MAPITSQIMVDCDTRYLALVREFVARAAQPCFSDPDLIHRVVVAVDEAMANVMEHSRHDSTMGGIRVETLATDDAFAVTIVDQGVYFDFTAHPDINLKDHCAAGKRNGLGIFIIRKIMDEVKYSFTSEHCNMLRLVKYVRRNSLAEAQNA